MFNRQREAEGNEEGLVLNITPLIDVIFILLIFFMVNTIFAKDTGVEVSKPSSAFGQNVQGEYLRIAVTADGELYNAGEKLTDLQVNRLAAEFNQKQPGGTIVLIPDTNAKAGRLVKVMDVLKSAGNDKIILATEKK